MSSAVAAAALGTLHVVGIGSKNPVKIAAARAVLGRIAPDVRVEAVDVPSTVRDQPFGDEETIRGALARARAAREATKSELGIGIEGGVVDADGTMRTCAWAAVVDGAGREGVGGSLAMPLPSSVAQLVRGGLELGHAMDRLTGEHGTKQRQGAVGILTAGLVDRQSAYEVILTYALARFLTPELW
ncbi:MAG TPA: inosine/xanthosine triphosphatase [Gemmatimonadaceae bacterium]|jgi:inosine/xanthosine triphosphatase